MLSAKRTSDGKTVFADTEFKRNAPFTCLVCHDRVILKTGRNKVNHFAHAYPLRCQFGTNESDLHRRCKKEICEALLKEPNVTEVAMERSFGTVRPDIYAKIKGVPVAIEVQISSLSLETIQYRTIEYHRKGIYVLWLLLWTPKLNAPRYAPTKWEKWIHAAYFGRVYYWLEELKVASYRFEPHLKSVPKTMWHSKDGERMTGGGYKRRSRRYRTPVRERILKLTMHFRPKERFWWEGNGSTVPDAKVYMAD